MKQHIETHDTKATEQITAANTGLAKVAVQCSADTFEVNQSLVLPINPDSYLDGENRHLRHARNRYKQLIIQILQ